MGNISFRIDDDLESELRDEAEEEGFGSLSAYLRHIILHRDERDRDVHQDVEELEARVRNLETLVADLDEQESAD